MSPHLVLAGGGHAHLFVLEGLAAGRFPSDLRVTLVSPVRDHVYSGMLPGLMAGRYRRAEACLDLAGLARAARVDLRQSAVVAVDPVRATLALADGDTVRYDIVSFAVGSYTAGTQRSGPALRVKPIDDALALPGAVDAVAATAGGREAAFVVVGAGAGGVELALNLRARLRRAKRDDLVTLVGREGDPLPGQARTARRAARRVLARNGIDLRLRQAVTEVRQGSVTLGGGERLTADLVLWATGPASPDFFRPAGLAVDRHGFLLVSDRLRSVSDPRIFGAGDAVSVRGHPDLPRNGVTAVRAGPVLRDNLAAVFRGAEPHRRLRSRRRTVSILNTGDGAALLTYGAVALTGRWLMRLKDRIDRRFMARFAPDPSAPDRDR